MKKPSEETMANIRRYEEVAHAVQSGVAMEMNVNPKPTEPKHLRVGVNMSKVDHAALVALLVEKGLFTDEEYTAALVKAVEEEKARYEQYLSHKLGTVVTLA